MITLETGIIDISRVGQTTAKRLNKIGIATVRNLLLYFPYRYDDFRLVVPINKLTNGVNANVIGQIEMIENRRAHRRRMYITEALVSDKTDSLKVIWFNQPYIAKNLKVGEQVSLAGKVESSKFEKTMISPVYEKITGRGSLHTGRLVPNYHLTANITQKQIRFLIGQVISLSKEFADWLPKEIILNERLLGLSEAINKIHFPADFKDLEKARQRLAFNELFLLQLQSQMIKKDLELARADKLVFFENETKKFVGSLPFKLTDSQRKAAWEILQDMKKDKPMARLLEGDVGSGKTLVAVIALLNAALNKKQSALMVPTEILAKQHFNTISQLLADFKVRIGLITSSGKKMNHEMQILNQEPTKKIKKIIQNSKFIIQNSDLVIGTHALIQDSIHFKNLALAIIDEQHRFGVVQRAQLLKQTNTGQANIVGAPLAGAQKRGGPDIVNVPLATRAGASPAPTGHVILSPHLLSMTATPIPRSLALTLYGDLDLSIISEMPKGRKQIITKIVPEAKREKAYEFIRQQIKDGRQIFVICPLIDISDKLGVKSVKEEFEKLDKHIFPELKIGLLHGKLKPLQKEKVMNEFLAGEIKILVSTSVVEVGVDVPNATVMMIEGAERFGLAQLHQFRGRVGRSDFQSYCFLFTDSLEKQSSPIDPGFSASQPDASKTLARLKAMENCFDGFALAKMDLKFRGPGEVYGTAQKGFPQLKIASLFDYVLIKRANEAAQKFIDKNPSLSSYPLLKNELAKYEKEIHLE